VHAGALAVPDLLSAHVLSHAKHMPDAKKRTFLKEPPPIIICSSKSSNDRVRSSTCTVFLLLCDGGLLFSIAELIEKGAWLLPAVDSLDTFEPKRASLAMSRSS
jgi:hypothetical protein